MPATFYWLAHTIATTATYAHYARFTPNEQSADCPRWVQFPAGFHLADIGTSDGPRTVCWPFVVCSGKRDSERTEMESTIGNWGRKVKTLQRLKSVWQIKVFERRRFLCSSVGYGNPSNKGRPTCGTRQGLARATWAGFHRYELIRVPSGQSWNGVTQMKPSYTAGLLLGQTVTVQPIRWCHSWVPCGQFAMHIWQRQVNSCGSHVGWTNMLYLDGSSLGCWWAKPIRVGSAHIITPCMGSMWAVRSWVNLIWTHMVPICFTPTCMLICKYGTRIGYIIHIWSHNCLYTSITDGVFSFCLYILLSPNFVITLMYSFAESPFRLALMYRPISLRDIIGDRRLAKGKFGAKLICFIMLITYWLKFMGLAFVPLIANQKIKTMNVMKLM